MKKRTFILLAILFMASANLPAQRLEVNQVDPSNKNQTKQSSWEQIKITLTSNTYFRVSQVNGNETLDFKYQNGSRKTVDKGQQLLLQLDDNEVVMLTSPQLIMSCKGCGAIGKSGSNSQGIQISYPLSNEDIAKLKSHKVIKYGFNTKEGYIESNISEKPANKIMVSLNLF